ncbi:MAG: precorrin-6y C5,15-methyltransferase (decarboxylating) subunit CbiE [Thermincolia bacterium]
MASPVYVVGIGPGALEYITPAAMEIIRAADVLIAGERTLSQFAGLGKPTFSIKNNLAEMVEFIEEQRASKRIAVLASGDPGMFGILNYLKKHFVTEDLHVIPGISSMQLACARLGISWHDGLLASTHGRGLDKVVELVRNHEKVILLTGPEATPAHIAKVLLEAGLRDKRAVVCGNLSYPHEIIIRGTLTDMAEKGQINNSVMVITDEQI